MGINRVLISSILLSLLLLGCSGITTSIKVEGCNNTIEILQDREGGSTVDVTPNTSWGNIQ